MLPVAGEHVDPGAEALGHRRDVAEAPLRPGVVAPPHGHAGHVGQHVAEGAQLPVEHRGDVTVVGHHAVVEPVVAVDDAGPLLGRDGVRQPGVEIVEKGHLPVRALVDLPLPPPELAGAVVLLASEVTEANRVRVEGVEGGEGVGQRVGHHRPHRRVDRLPVGPVEDDPALDEAHHVEGGAVDGLVLAEPDHGRHRNRGVLERGDDPVLPAHVVGAGEHVPRRRPAQHELLALGVGDAEREVRRPAGDELELERCDDVGAVGHDPLGHRTGVDAGRCAHVPAGARASSRSQSGSPVRPSGGTAWMHTWVAPAS